MSGDDAYTRGSGRPNGEHTQRVAYTFHTVCGLLKHLDEREAEGAGRYEYKGDLIKVAGALRDEAGVENADYDGVDPGEWFP